LTAWKKPAQRPKGCTQEEFEALPASMTLRHVGLTASASGHRTQTITLLDAVAYPLQQLGELYLQRWSVEPQFREIKINLGRTCCAARHPSWLKRK
jgi:hypothetical protein